MENLVISVVEKADLQEILELQKAAFETEAPLYPGHKIPRLLQTLADLEKEFETQTFLKAMQGNRIVGSVRIHIPKPGTCHIAALIVHPDLYNRGIGKALMQAAETYFDGITRIELFTGSRSEKNLSLYKKLGYRTYRIKPIVEDIYMLYLEKWCPGGQC